MARAPKLRNFFSCDARWDVSFRVLAFRVSRRARSSARPESATSNLIYLDPSRVHVGACIGVRRSFTRIFHPRYLLLPLRRRALLAGEMRVVSARERRELLLTAAALDETRALRRFLGSFEILFRKSNRRKFLRHCERLENLQTLSACNFFLPAYDHLQLETQFGKRGCTCVYTRTKGGYEVACADAL